MPRRPNPLEHSDRLFKVLAELYKNAKDTNWLAGLNEMEIAQRSGIVPSDVFSEPLIYLQKYRAVIRSALDVLKERGLVNWEASDEKVGRSLRIHLTASGIKYAQHITRAWWRKTFDYLKDDLRALVFSVITAIISIIATILVQKILGLS